MNPTARVVLALYTMNPTAEARTHFYHCPNCRPNVLGIQTPAATDYLHDIRPPFHLSSTNNPPTEAEALLVRRNMREAGARLVNIDVLILDRTLRKKTGPKVDALVQKRHELCTTILQNCSIISSLRRVPGEIFLEIFEYAVRPSLEDGHIPIPSFSHRTPWNISRVCSQWRALSLTLPTLWSDIFVSGTNPLPLPFGRLVQLTRLRIPASSYPASCFGRGLTQMTLDPDAGCFQFHTEMIVRELPVLRALRVSHTWCLRSLTTPALEDLHVDGNIDPDHLVSLIHRSGCRLRVLGLELMLGPEEGLAILEGIPTLHELRWSLSMAKSDFSTILSRLIVPDHTRDFRPAVPELRLMWLCQDSTLLTDEISRSLLVQFMESRKRSGLYPTPDVYVLDAASAFGFPSVFAYTDETIVDSDLHTLGMNLAWATNHASWHPKYTGTDISPRPPIKAASPPRYMSSSPNSTAHRRVSLNARRAAVLVAAGLPHNRRGTTVQRL